MISIVLDERERMKHEWNYTARIDRYRKWANSGDISIWIKVMDSSRLSGSRRDLSVSLKYVIAMTAY